MKTQTFALRAACTVSVLFLCAGSLFAGNITRPGDPVVPSSNNSPGSGAENSPNAIDNNVNTKYLNFDKLNTGFTVTPTMGSSVCRGITLVSANDAPERDPASFLLEGSN